MWDFIQWASGILLGLFVLRFIFIAIKTLLSKDNINAILDSTGNWVMKSNKKFKKYLNKKVSEKKAKKNDIKPVITIR